MEVGVLRHGDVSGGGRSGQGQAATASDAAKDSNPGQRGHECQGERCGRGLVDRQPAGGTSLSSGSAEASNGKPNERLRRLRGRGRRVPRWVPHTTPSSLPERYAWLLAGADHQLASLGQSERAGPPPAVDRGGERRPDDGDDGDNSDDGVVDDRRRDDVPTRRPGDNGPRIRCV